MTARVGQSSLPRPEQVQDFKSQNIRFWIPKYKILNPKISWQFSWDMSNSKQNLSKGILQEGHKELIGEASPTAPPSDGVPGQKLVKNKSTIFLSFLLTMKKVSFRTPLGHGLRSHYRPFASTETPGASARVGKLTDRKQSPRFLGRAPRSIRIPLSTPQHHFMLTCSKTAKREPIPHHD